METQIQRVTHEIPYRGIGYLIFRHCAAAERDRQLPREIQSLEEQGAKEIYVASTDPETPLAEGAIGTVRLTHVHDMLEMERDLDGNRPRRGGRLRAVPLTEVLGEQWLTLYNEAFSTVPNAATYGREELAEMLDKPGSCGLVLEDDMPVGIYELDLQTGEIEGIGLAETARGRGLGREFLLLAMDLLAERGYKSCWLQVSTGNPAAYQLYQKTGFCTRRVRSRWFKAEATGQKDRNTEEDGI